MDGDIRFNVAGDFAGVHVGGVLEVSSKAMVLADEGVEDISKVDVGVLVTSIDTTMLVVELNSTSNGLGQCKLGSLGDDASQFVPFLLGDVLSHQRVLGLDIGERLASGHCAKMSEILVLTQICMYFFTFRASFAVRYPPEKINKQLKFWPKK